MLIFQLLNQYVGIAKAAMFGCSAKLNKSFKTNIIETLLLIMCIPRKINFMQFGRYGDRGEQCYRQTFTKEFDWLGFNMNLYNGQRTGKRGAPKKYDGRIDVENPDKLKMARVWIDPSVGTAYELVAWCKALGCKIKLVILYRPDRSYHLYFSTRISMTGREIYDIYHTRFQIEFCYRDGHQFTGLIDCQGRDEKTLDFAYNASFAAVNITKLMIKEYDLPLSIGQIKSLTVNAHFAQRFFAGCGIDPDPTLNAKLFKELFGYVAKAG